ncbi:MAG: thermonuclease family protein [Verrucomicrobiales bacterium]|nr:thermonuclease family protein [Verrucomicrobiales bacterium]
MATDRTPQSQPTSPPDARRTLRGLSLLSAGLFSILLLLPGGSPTAGAATADTPKVPKTPAPANPTKAWATFRDCEYVDDPSNDADSFRVKCGRKSFHVRLYFVDAPETKATDPARVAEQAEHFGLSTDATLAAGVRAAEATRRWLTRSFDVHTRWTVAGGRSREPRYYAIVEADGKDLGEHLVSLGWARSKGAVAPPPNGEPSRSVVQRLQRLEADARRGKLGAWASPPRTPSPPGTVPAPPKKPAPHTR